jgi:hypothetical protein
MAMRHILSAIHKADLDYGLIEDNDRICVGVSGGKDSMLLLYALRLYKDMISRYDGRQIEVAGIHLDLGFGGMDFSEADAFCREKDIELMHIPTDIYEILKLHPVDENGRISCSICSRLKKGALALVGTSAERMIRGFHVDLAVCSCKGLDINMGITDSNEKDSCIKQAIFASAERKVLAVDSTKFDKISFVRVCDASEVDTIVTDCKPADRWIEYFNRKDIELVY